MAAILLSVGLMVTQLLSATTDTIAVIVAQPILMVGVTLSICFAGITLFHKIRG